MDLNCGNLHAYNKNNKKSTVKQKPQYFELKKPQKHPQIDYERYYSETQLKQTPT
jgi:hypothetical protein